MRITNKMITASLIATVSRNRALAADLQLDLATTKRVRKPSDDPSGISQIQRFNLLIGRNEQYLKNITQIGGFVSNASLAVDSITDLLERAKEIAVQGATGTLNADARQILANSVDQLMDDLVDLGNTSFNDRFVFAGTLTKGTEPLARSGDAITYSGNDKDIHGKIGSNIDVTYNKTGIDVFNPPGGTDLFATLAALKQGLEANDTNVIQNTMDQIGNAIVQTISISAEFGLLQNKLNSTEELIETENVRYADFLSRIQDTDVVETLVNFQNLENAITVGLRTMADIVQTSLLDFIA